VKLLAVDQVSVIHTEDAKKEGGQPASRTKCGCNADRETESDTSNEQQAEPVHGILLEK
jgi:hypothetical protein